MNETAANPLSSKSFTRKSGQGLFSWIATVDHKRIGILYLLTAFSFSVWEAWKLWLCACNWPNQQPSFVPDAYDQLFTMHGTTMIFWCDAT